MASSVDHQHSASIRHRPQQLIYDGAGIVAQCPLGAIRRSPMVRAASGVDAAACLPGQPASRNLAIVGEMSWGPASRPAFNLAIAHGRPSARWLPATMCQSNLLLHEAPALVIACIEGRIEKTSVLEQARAYGSILPTEQFVHWNSWSSKRA